MTRRRNVRDKQLRRWALRAMAYDRRNGVEAGGRDLAGVGQVLPWAVEAYLARGPVVPRMSTRNYRRAEWSRVGSGTRRNTTP